MFGSAKQAEIIRSNQKDEYYAGYIKGSLTDVVQTFLGPRTWIQWRKELDLAADIGYFALTTLAGYQTLGEEYVNILQVDETHRAIPSRLTRAAMILLQVSTPYILNKLLSYCERQLQHNPNIELTREGREALLGAIPALRHAITLIHRCHLAWFYMRGSFYHIAKRFTGIHYVLVRSGFDEASRPNYRILGWLSVIQLAITFLQQACKYYQRRGKPQDLLTTSEPQQTPGIQKAEAEEGDYSSPSSKCALCLETRKHSTATPCGHLFCWDCIHEWYANKAECPLCREEFEVSRLIYLQNYDPV